MYKKSKVVATNLNILCPGEDEHSHVLLIRRRSFILRWWWLTNSERPVCYHSHNFYCLLIFFSAIGDWLSLTCLLLSFYCGWACSMHDCYSPWFYKRFPRYCLTASEPCASNELIKEALFNLCSSKTSRIYSTLIWNICTAHYTAHHGLRNVSTSLLMGSTRLPRAVLAWDTHLRFLGVDPLWDLADRQQERRTYAPSESSMLEVRRSIPDLHLYKDYALRKIWGPPPPLSKKIRDFLRWNTTLGSQQGNMGTNLLSLMPKGRFWRSAGSLS